MEARKHPPPPSVHRALAVGIALRLLLVWASPAEGMHGGDLSVYHDTANRLANAPDAWLQVGELGYRAPLYFVFLAVVYLPFPAEAPYAAGQLANTLLLAPILLAYRGLGPALGLGPRAVATVLWLRATLPVFVVSDVQLLSEPLFEALLLSGMLLAERLLRSGSTTIRAVLAGAVLAALLLTREIASVFMVAIAVAYLPLLLGRPARLERRHLAVAALAFVLTLAPWLARNQAVYGQAVPLSHSSGPNLHVGHNPGADGRWNPIVGEDHQLPDSLRWATPAASSWHRGRALEFAREDPARVLSTVPWKLGYLVFPRAQRRELLDDEIFPALPRSARILLIGLVGLSSAALVLALPAALVALPPGAYRRTALVAAGLYVLAVAVTFGDPRFLDPLLHLALPGVGVLAVVGPSAALAGASRRARIGVLSASLVIVFLWGLVLSTKL